MSSSAAAPRSFRGHPVDEVLAVPKLAVYGFQHVLAFYAGAVIVPILLASAIHLSTEQLIHLINADLLTCGIASIIQSAGIWKIGVRLPLLQGVTFASVSPMIAIGLAAGGATDGLVVIYGAVIVAGLLTLLVAPYFGRLIRFFPPVVTGSVITIIGIALLPVAALNVVGGGSNPQPTDGRNLGYAVGTLALIVGVQRLFRGFLATVAVLVGLVVGTLVAWVLGDATFSAVTTSSWLGVTTPFYFGWPRFSVAAIISMIVVMVITSVETTGDVFATGEIVDKRVSRDDITRALRADGLATAIGGVLNSFPYTCFAQNVGLVRLTGIKSRWVVTAAGAFMVVLGLLPKVASVVASIPPPVLGGAALAMFATVAVVGIQTLSRVDLHDQRNVIIVATSVGLALLVTAQPDVAKAVPSWAQVILGSGITIGSLTAILLNIVFHHLGGGTNPTQPPAGIGLAVFNRLPEADLEPALLACCSSRAWATTVLAGRPYTDTAEVIAAADRALAAMTGAELDGALAGHPRIGERPTGAGAESSRREQSGVTDAPESLRRALAEANQAYERRFGHVYLVCAAGKDARQLLDLLRARLSNDPRAERAVLRGELAKINRLRLERLLA